MPQHPPFPQQPPAGQYIRHIWAYQMLNADAARSRILPLAMAADRRQSPQAKDDADTFWAAHQALVADVHDAAERALRDGCLLFCWHGTTATGLGQERAE